MSDRNGHATRPLREQVQGLRLELEATDLRTQLAQARLQENWWGGMGGWGAGAWGAGAWGTAFDPATKHGFGAPAALIAGGKQGRVGGRNLPFVWTEVNADFARGAARWLAVENRIAQGILEHLCNFTVKTGFTYEGRPKKGWERDATAVECARVLQAVVDEFAEQNDWPLREREAVYWAVVDGDRFLRTFAQEDGSTLVREIEPEQVGQPPTHAADPNCLHGIQTDPHDIQRPINYFATYDGIEYHTIPAAEVAHLKRNVPRTVKRGLSDFYSTDEALDCTGKLLRNMPISASVQAAIAWIEQYAQASGATAAAAAAARRDSSRPTTQDPVTGRTPSYQRYEPGSVPLVSGGREYLPPPQAVGASVHIQIVQAALRAVGNRWCMAEYMVSGEADEVVANAMVSGSPFVTKIECEQALTFKPFFLRVLWTAVKNAAVARRFRTADGRVLTYADVRALCELHATPPKVAISAKLEDFQVDDGLVKAGAMSLQTLRARHDLDNDQETANLKREPVQQPAPPPGQPGQGGQGGGLFPPRDQGAVDELRWQGRQLGEALRTLVRDARLLREGSTPA